MKTNRPMKRAAPGAAGRRLMKLALELARRGGTRVWPNPQVGAVIVKDGIIIGEGWHEYFGGPHAEINALRKAGKRAAGADLYVTLEPCTHWGKTPPCTDAIIAAGIARVFFAMPDPNPVTAGKSAGILSAAGIAVTRGLLRHEAERLNRTYCSRFKKRPARVIAKAALSMDGRIAAKTGDARWITSPASRRFGHRLRAGADAILVGATTVVRDNPSLTAHGQGTDPVRVIIDPSLRVPLSSSVLDAASPTVIIHGPAVQPGRIKAFLRKGVRLIPVKPAAGGRMDFRDILHELNIIGISRILIEGGGETIAAALDAGVVDEVYFFVAPKIIGGRTAPGPVGGEGPDRVAEAVSVNDLTVRRIGGDLLLRGTIQRRTQRQE